jgi:hypothetical protein
MSIPPYNIIHFKMYWGRDIQAVTKTFDMPGLMIFFIYFHFLLLNT